MASLIPRFAIPFGPAAFFTACRASLAAEVPAPADLAPVFGNRPLIWTGSGRQALSLLLVALKLGRNAKVAIPLFSSSAVAAAVKAAGCEPVYIDVDPRTLTMDPNELARVRSRISAVVPVHLFGNVADMDRIMEAAGGVPVIEDTAQCLTGNWRGRLAGTFGVASFYSFASSKCLAAGGGGLAAVNGADLVTEMRGLASNLLPRGRIGALRCAAMQFAKSILFSRALYGPLGNRLRAKTEDTGYLLATVDARAIAASSAAAIPKVARGFSARMRRQRENSLKLIDSLRHASGIVLPLEPSGARFGYTLFPVLASSEEERDALRRLMLARGVDTSAAHHNCVEIGAKSGYCYRSCPVSEQVARRILTLPNSAELAPADVERVASVFLDSLKAARAAGRVRKIFEAHAV